MKLISRLKLTVGGAALTLKHLKFKCFVFFFTFLFLHQPTVKAAGNAYFYLIWTLLFVVLETF